MKHRKNAALIMLPIALLLTACASEDMRVSPTHQRKFRDEDEKNTLVDVITKGERRGKPAPSKGNTRVFVVPIEFKDYPADEIGKYYNSKVEGNGDNGYAHRYEDSTAEGRGAENALRDIEAVYFGEPEDTYWHSLASYYKESSYNQLRFNGIVAPWYRPVSDIERPEDTWQTAKEWAKSRTAAAQLADQVVNYYADDVSKHYLELTKEDGTAFTSGQDFLQYFDSDKDGFFDLVEMVYSAPFYATDVAGGVYKKGINNDIFWAYCGDLSSYEDANVTRPSVNKYAFFSYYTFVEAGKLVEGADGEFRFEKWTTNEISDGTAKMDAHTLIHETGHAIGLPDYYDTSYSGKNPIGSVDMMCMNVGDHNSYSKTQLGWVDPIVVTGATQVTIRSFTDTGDCIMVPYRGFYKDHEEKGNSSNIEYLAIELYTPTGVNKTDSEHNYAGNYPLCPSIPGVKIYHVDSRLGIFSAAQKFTSFTETITNMGQNGYVSVASSNSNDQHVEDFWQIEFLPRSSETTMTLVDNTNLWQAGDTFNTAENYTDFVMNETRGEEETEIPFGYKITIKECSANGATILIEGVK